MAWSIEQLRHNASVLYNDLCSDRADRVYLDVRGDLQVDTRSRFKRIFTSLGDSSIEIIDKAAIRVLRRVLNALESGALNPDQIIIQERIPAGLFMDGGDTTSSIIAIKNALVSSDGAGATSVPSIAVDDRRWINRRTFGMNIRNADRFKTWQRLTIGGPSIADSELSREQLVDRKVTVLTQQIIHGKDSYQGGRDDFNFYDVSDSES